MEKITTKQSILRSAQEIANICLRDGKHLNGDEMIYIAMNAKHILEETGQDFLDHSIQAFYKSMVADDKRRIFNCSRS